MSKLNIISLIILGAVACACTDHGPDAPGKMPDKGGNSGDVEIAYVGKFYRQPHSTVNTEAANTFWCDTVWAGERVSNQLLLTANVADVENLNIAVEAPDGFDVDNFRFRAVEYVLGDAAPAVDNQPLPRTTAMVADALVDELPTKLRLGEQKAVWVSVDVPRDISAGKYSGSIIVKSGEKAVATADYSLLVTGHILSPPTEWSFHLDIWQFPFRLKDIIADNSGVNIKAFSQQHFDLLRPFYAILADAGQKCITTYIKDGAFNKGQTMIAWSKQGDNWYFDYTDFDAYVEFMMSLGISEQISCFSLAGWNNSVGYIDLADGGKYKYLDLPIGSGVFNEVWTAFLIDFREHLTAKGWFDKTVLCMDENTNEQMQKIVSLIRANGDDWKIAVSGHNMDTDLERQLYNYSTIIGSYPKSTTIAKPIFYTSCSQTHPNNYLTPENPSAEMTWMAWHAMARGFKGYQRWAFDYWYRPDPFDTCDGRYTAGDFHMIYRSDNTAAAKPVSSIRWEMLRDGIQDYEKCSRLDTRSLRSTLVKFLDITAPDAEARVSAAQSELKKLSAQ